VNIDLAGAVSSVRSRRVRVRCCGVRPGKARQVWPGGTGFVSARRVPLGQGKAGMVGLGELGLGEAGSGRVWQVRRGKDGLGWVR